MIMHCKFCGKRVREDESAPFYGDLRQDIDVSGPFCFSCLRDRGIQYDEEEQYWTNRESIVWPEGAASRIAPKKEGER